MSSDDKDAEIANLRAEVVELRKGLKDMAGDMGKMQKEFGQIVLAMGRAMGYVDPKDTVAASTVGASTVGSLTMASSPTTLPTSETKSEKSNTKSSVLSLSSSSKGETTDESTVSSVVEEKKPEEKKKVGK